MALRAALAPSIFACLKATMQEVRDLARFCCAGCFRVVVQAGTKRAIDMFAYANLVHRAFRAALLARALLFCPTFFYSCWVFQPSKQRFWRAG